MKEYKIIFLLKPAVRLNPNLENIILNFEEIKSKKVVISKIEEIVSDQKIQSGLKFELFIKAEDNKEAINEAKSFVDGIVSFISLATGVGLDIPIEVLSYEITPDVKEREFLQAFYNPFGISISRRVLDEKFLIELIDKFMKLNPTENGHMARAIQWYRMGTITSNIFDKFNCFWIGLESLNSSLQEKFFVKDDATKCPKCRHEWISTPTVSGIRAFVQGKIPDGSNLYRRFRDLRINIMHSKTELGELNNEASELNPKIAETLFRAICYVLEFEKWNEISYKKILDSADIRIELDGKLIGENPNLLGPEGKDPFLEPEHKIFNLKLSSDGSPMFDGKSTFTARLNTGVQFRPSGIRFYGDTEMSGGIKKMEINKKENSK